MTEGDFVAPPGQGVNLRMFMRPGDVLSISGNSRFEKMGSSGGFLGHVLVVLGEPRRVERGSVEHTELKLIWPKGEREPQVWKVAIIECTRLRSGMSRSEVVLRVDPQSGCLTMIGELIPMSEGEVRLGITDGEPAELWQSPAALRQGLRSDLLIESLEELEAEGGTWSFATAAQALYHRSAKLDDEADSSELLELVQQCWESPPICTSVVISLWQRYLCKFAFASGWDEVDSILHWMPLRADRGLPGELLSTMQRCGWTRMRSLLPDVRRRSYSEQF